MKKIGIKDIAEHVGVSVALVSYVLNGQAKEKQVSKASAEKIKKAALELNYQPNQIAKSLKMRKTHTIGLVVADINYRFSTGITRAIESEAKKNNYTVIYGSSNESEEKFNDLIDVFINRRVDGLIVVPVENSQDKIEQLKKSDLPFLLIDRIFPELKTNYIALDNFKAAYTATEYLIKTGHRRIAFLNYQTTLFHLLERNRGYQQALKDNGIVFENDWLQEIDNNGTKESVQSSLEHIVKDNRLCDAVFFATDTLAFYGLMHFNKVRLSIPDDISVLSFDGSDAFDLFNCPITHGNQPLEKMGKVAVKTLVDMVGHKYIDQQISMEADLVIGKSCREI